MPQQSKSVMKGKPKPPPQNDFGFDFGGGEANSLPIKSQMFKDKASMPAEEEDAVIEPKSSKITMKDQLQNR